MLTIQCGHQRLHGKLHLFGGEFALAAKNAPDGIPFIIKKCASEIEKRALHVKGIYRMNGVKLRVEKLCLSFENGRELVDLSELCEHDIADVLKLYLRKLPEPLFLFHFYEELIGLAKESQNLNEDPKQASPEGAELSKVLKKIKVLLKQLPGSNYNTIKYLIGHLNRVVQKSAENKMPATNLGIVFGPTLIRPQQSDDKISLSALADCTHQVRFVELLIAYYEKIFDVSQSVSTSPIHESPAIEPQKPESCLSSKEDISLAHNESIISDTSTSLIEELHDNKNGLEGAHVPVNESAMSSVFDETKIYPFKNKNKLRANGRSEVRCNQITLRSPRIKTSVRPVSLPVDGFLPPHFLNANNSKNMETSNADKFGRSSADEEMSETKSSPNSSSRLCCYDPKAWVKPVRQDDTSTRTAMIMPSTLKASREAEGGAACILSPRSKPPPSLVTQLSQPDVVPAKVGRVISEGFSLDSNRFAAFRARRTLQPPPGTFYTPHPNNKVKDNEEDFPETSVGANPENASDSPGHRVSQPKASLEELPSPSIKPVGQRLRPKRLHDLEQREAQFV